MTTADHDIWMVRFPFAASARIPLLTVLFPSQQRRVLQSAQRPGKPADLKIDCLVLGGGQSHHALVVYFGPSVIDHQLRAGLCGLATAIALKRAGHNVTVVERDPVTEKVCLCALLATFGMMTEPACMRLCLDRGGLEEDVVCHRI